MRFSLALLLVTVAAAPAAAETITGTFTFTDFDGAPSPIANATVEVWRNKPGGPFGWYSWSMDATATTDASGRLNVSVPYWSNNVQTQLRVYAINPAVVVRHQDEPWQAFYAVPPQTFVTTGPGNMFDFTNTFTDSFSASHYNVAQAVQTARNYALAHRDPRETDTIGQMSVDMQNPVTLTYYDPTVHEIRLAITYAMDDYSIIHEYAHFLEHQISTFQAQASYHDGCSFLTSQGGVDISSPSLAWMEGFADYFSQAVARANPTGPTRVTGNQLGTIHLSSIETSPCATTTPETAEDDVAGALWDLVDNANEPSDHYCSAHFDTETIIFQIFDHELAQLGGNPRLQDFLDAWVGRGYDVPLLAATWGSTMMSRMSRPMTKHHYDPSPNADFAIWNANNGNWWVLWQNQSQDVTQWGQPNDVPVPGDYDGDHVTDLAVWRPSDGNWYVLLSGSGGIPQISQWGQPGDIPLPADYDGDGEIDFAVYRPSDGLVYVKDDNCGFNYTISVGFGTPVVGQFDGDHKADPGVFAGNTFTIQSTAAHGAITQVMPNAGAPALADYDGDGRTDLAVFGALQGLWTIIPSTNSSGTFVTYLLGAPLGKLRALATAVPADYSGTGVASPAVWYPINGMWYVLEPNGSIVTQQWGASSDRPVPR